MSAAIEEAFIERVAEVDDKEDASERQRQQGSAPPSPSTSDELALSDDEGEGRRKGSDMSAVLAQRAEGPQTGVKGVRADAAYAAQIQREQRAEGVRATNQRLESMALGGTQTSEMDSAVQRAEAAAGVKPGQPFSASRRADSDDEELAEIRRRRLQNIKSQTASNENRRKRLAGEGDKNGSAHRNNNDVHFGHLREVTRDQYPNAVEGEAPSTSVVVHIYVRNVHACAMLTSALASLARIHTKTKFLQARAGGIGFGSSASMDKTRDSGNTPASLDGTLVDSASTLSGGDISLNEQDADERAEDLVPTLLIYRAGKVVANLVRVDLEEAWRDGTEAAIAELLEGYNALQS